MPRLSLPAGTRWQSGARWFALVVLLSVPLQGQTSRAGLRFQGSTSGQQDLARVALDDNGPGPDASAPCDVGVSDFTLELWVRGRLADNASSHGGGDVETFDESWLDGNVLLDRHHVGSTATFGVSLAGGFVRFGTGAGSGGAPHTLEGDVDVLDDRWHHVACVREAATGTKHVYVDGVLDVSSSPGVSPGDLSFPNAGQVGGPWGPFLFVGAARSPRPPPAGSFAGRLDELRLWSRALDATQIRAGYFRTVPAGSPGLVGDYRFEEGAGTELHDSSDAHSPEGELVAGLPGNGEWSLRSSGPLETAPVTGHALPTGFRLEKLAGGFDQLTSLVPLPDDRLLLGEHGGKIRVWKNGGLLPVPLITIPLAQTLEAQGLLSLAVDPGFAQNGHVYAYYTTGEPRNRVSRFTVVGDTASPASELVLWENPDLAGDDHLGGGLAVDDSGHLFIATGDQEHSEDSQDLTREHGKLLRLRVDGSIPPDNPFVSIPGARPAIWARGLRNPFRMKIDRAGGRLWIADVGGNKSGAWEELHLARVAADYGWPHQEGPDCNGSDCSTLEPPVFAYRHDDHEYHFGQDQAAIIAGPLYGGTLFPPQWQGRLFLADYANRWIRALTVDPLGNVTADEPFLGSQAAGSIVDLEEGADGALYFVTFGSFVSGDSEDSALWRVDYSAAGNLPPVAIASAPSLSGLPPATVSFTSAGSFDPDGAPGALTYAWDFGDGSQSTLADPVHVYTTAGPYTARLTVSDGAQETLSEELQVIVGTPPVPVISSSPISPSYVAGDRFTFTGSATDAEDGVLGPFALNWRKELVHLGHGHPKGSVTVGTAVTKLRIPRVGHGPEDTVWAVTLTATDSDGLATSVRLLLDPLEAPLLFDTWPSGIPLFLDGQAEATPRAYTSLPEFRHKLRAQPYFTHQGRPWFFSHWSNRRPLAHTLEAPAGGAWLRAFYRPGVESAVAVDVAATDRNAEHSQLRGQQASTLGDPLALGFGRRVGDVLQAGFEFDLPVPQGARIVSASLELRAGLQQSGPLVATLWAYDIASAPAFVVGSPTALTAHAPLGGAYVRWAAAAPVPGQVVSTPDLAAVLQGVVERSDWVPGGTVGIVIDGTPTEGTAWQTVGNLDSGTAPRLHLVYAVPGTGPWAPPAQER